MTTNPDTADKLLPLALQLLRDIYKWGLTRGNFEEVENFFQYRVKEKLPTSQAYELNTRPQEETQNDPLPDEIKNYPY